MSFGSPYFTLPRFKYLRPESLQEALRILKENGEEARVMAGGVGLLNLMKERLADPKIIVDLKGIRELHTISFSKDEGLYIGSTITMNELLDYPPVKEYPALFEAVYRLSDHNLRNRSTLVGDLCEALPWVDSPAPLIAYDAIIEIAGEKGMRYIKAEDFIKGMAQVDLSPDEIITCIKIPYYPSNWGKYYKFSTGSEFSLASMAMVAKADGEIEIVYGGVSEVPYHFREFKEMMKRYPPDRLVSEAVSYIKSNFEPMSDYLASSDYRKRLMELLLVQGLRDYFERGR